MFKFSFYISILVLLSCSPKLTTEFTNIDASTFKYGVASGDPTETSVIIWTKLNGQNGNATVDWTVSKDSLMTKIVKSGRHLASPESGHTIKIDVQELQSGLTYFYQFQFENGKSMIGRTKTLGEDWTDMSIGVVSCSNFEWGYFNAYKSLSEKDIDLVIHLGDYIYEYEPNRYGDKTLSRKHLPPKEIQSLEDYRIRYAQYRSDPDLQRIHSRHPFITIWDDHEITNNAYQSGGENHQVDEGDYSTKKQIAKQVYYEWMPIRPSGEDKLYRTISCGKFADIILLDERLEGRTKQLESSNQASINHSMLGQNQLAWFKNQLRSSDATWKIIGNQVIFSPLDLNRVSKNRPINLDAWDGYSTERNGIISYIKNEEINNVVFLTGDTHSSWAFEIPFSKISYAIDKVSYGVEIGTTSINSGNWNEGSPTEEVIMREKTLLASNPHLKYVNGRDHGYVILNLTQENAVVEWYYVSNLKSREFTPKLGKSLEFSVDNGNKIY